MGNARGRQQSWRSHVCRISCQRQPLAEADEAAQFDASMGFFIHCGLSQLG